LLCHGRKRYRRAAIASSWNVLAQQALMVPADRTVTVTPPTARTRMGGGI
jgi:hypothetical protein